MVCPDFDTKNCQPVETQWMPVPESAIMTPMQTATNKSIVKVQSDQAAARYRCQAFNKLGSDSHIIKFIRRGKRFQCVSEQLKFFGSVEISELFRSAWHEGAMCINS